MSEKADKGPDRTKPQSGSEWRHWGRWLLLAVLIGGAIYLLIMLLRRTGSRALITAVPVMAGAVMARSAVQERNEALEDHLREVAEKEALIPPVQLYQRLRERGDGFTSEQQMARELRKLGLRSEIRTIKGRTERRWYNLSGYSDHE